MDFLFKHIKKNYFMLSENQKDVLPITKKEEHEALQLIRDRGIPDVVLSWNKNHAANYPSITEEEVKKHIKKKYSDGYIESTNTYYIAYQSLFIKNERSILINFFINKTKAGILVKYQDNMGNGHTISK